VKEQTPENLARDLKIYEPPRFMTVNEAIRQLLEIEDRRKEKGKHKQKQLILLPSCPSLAIFMSSTSFPHALCKFMRACCFRVV
jgi:hypothetical protein